MKSVHAGPYQRIKTAVSHSLAAVASSSTKEAEESEYYPAAMVKRRGSYDRWLYIQVSKTRFLNAEC